MAVIRQLVPWALAQCVKLLLLLAAVSVASFGLMELSPIDPVQAYIGADMMRVSAEQREAIAAYWGLDQPPIEQFGRWLTSLLQGDMGTSMIYRTPVTEVLAEKFTASMWLMGTAWLLSGLLGFGAGVLAAMKEGSWLDRVIQWVCYTLASTPSFWLAIMLLLAFSVWLGWLPVGLGTPAGVLREEVSIADRLHHMILPVLTLSVVGISAIALHTREKLIEVLHSDYVLYARAQGERGLLLVWRHGLRNIALPAVSLQFASFSELFGGAVLAEQVFAYPGLGQATVEAGLRGDVPLLLGIVLFSTVFVFCGNMTADMLYRILDPRTREVKA